MVAARRPEVERLYVSCSLAFCPRSVAFAPALSSELETTADQPFAERGWHRHFVDPFGPALGVAARFLGLDCS